LNKQRPKDAVFHPLLLEDIKWWTKTDRKKAIRLLTLIEDILQDPFNGIGKPEPLKFITSDAWSRRLAQEHRIIYMVKKDRIVFLRARYHY
jgi:toxin YoeB